MHRNYKALALAVLSACAHEVGSPTDDDARMTTADGARVDGNVYTSKADVYVGGAPDTLPSGDYYFQVTDPNGSVVLSLDDIDCRRIHLDGGVISEVYRGSTGCMHGCGANDNGGLTVRLMPFRDTPSHTAEYTVWLTRVDHYDDGFYERYSNTDSFKIAPSALAAAGDVAEP
jgi:hypothetical protein